ncbi:hypothetical protein R1T08_17080 [Streptomyces sp. SBC-4]|nr:hypothetical protein [Streptomyces sp. SBC-4]MDV5145874.1 hypothetical protein [Streptomyces sp. SBC-4]
MTTNSIARTPHPAQSGEGEQLTSPANLPAGTRRPVLVLLAPPRPTSVPAALLAAARILQANGLWQDDYFPDAFNRVLTTPHASRPLSIVAAIRCAVAGDPRRETQLADMAIGYVALSLDDEPAWPNAFSLQAHVDNWGDEPGRTTDEAVALLERLATTSERAA